MIRIIGNEESAVSVRIRPYDTIPLDTTGTTKPPLGQVLGLFASVSQEQHTFSLKEKIWLVPQGHPGSISKIHDQHAQRHGFDPQSCLKPVWWQMPIRETLGRCRWGKDVKASLKDSDANLGYTRLWISHKQKRSVI